MAVRISTGKLLEKIEPLIGQCVRSDELKAVKRSVRRIKASEKDLILLETADRLVTAVGRPDLLHFGIVEVEDGDIGDNEEQIQPKRRPPVPPGVPAKKCPGPLCQGQPRPLSEFYFRKRGKGVGRPRSWCKECEIFKSQNDRRRLRQYAPGRYEEALRRRRLRERQQHKDWQYDGLVPYPKVGFATEELCREFGPKKVASLLGVSRSALWYWRTQRVEQIRKEYAARILQLLWEVRNGNSSKKT